VLESPVYELAAGGGDQFRNFVIPVELDAPRWIKAIELRPTNPRVTHHARLGIDTTGESARRDVEDIEPGYDGMAWGEDPGGQLVAWAPGMTATPGLAGSAWRLQPQSELVLHTHLQPSGKRERVQFRIGLHFVDSPPTVRPVILRIGSRNVDIPAGEPRHVISDTYELPIAVDVHSIFPHAHSLCKEVRVRAKLADGKQLPLLWIKSFDEKWHENYRYVAPLRLPRGTQLVTEFIYDNSDANVRNRHRPPERTAYGSNAADEMQDVYLQVTAANPDERAALLEDFSTAEQKSKLVGYAKSLEKYPDDPWSRDGLAVSYLALNRPLDAIRELNARIKRGKPEVHTVAMLGMALLAAGDHAQAEKVERQAIEMDGKYPLAWLGLGKVLAAQNKTIEAEQSFRRALELALALTDANFNRAEILFQQGDLADAAVACEAILETAPDTPNAYLKLAEIRTKQGRIDDSLQLLETAHRLAPYIHPPNVLQAVYLVQNGQPERARALIIEAQTEEPQHPVPPLFLGQLARSNDPAAARRYYEASALLPLPTNWPASNRDRFLVMLHSARFELAQDLEDKAMARNALTEWVKHDPENKQLREVLERLQPTKEP
jgi:tetratricopeptide (TPR) repeat protein